MPFRGANGGPADVVLKQTGDNSFEVMQPFWYDVPGTSISYEVWKGFATDLASAPWFFWWLFSSYGHQTRAALVHDTLVGSDARVQIPRKEADWVFYTALEDAPPDGDRGDFLRHQFAWVAVCVFGTMMQCARLLLGLFLANVLLLWFAFFAAILGGPWLSGRVWWIVFAGTALVGFLWKFNPQADRRLSARLWPVGAPALLLVTPATIVILATTAVLWLLEAPVSLVLHRWPPKFHPYMRIRL